MQRSNRTATPALPPKLLEVQATPGQPVAHLDTTLGLTADEWALVREATHMQLVLTGLPGFLHVPASLLLSARISGLAARYGAEQKDQGLEPGDIIKGTKLGLLASGPVWLAILGGAWVAHLQPLYRDESIRNATFKHALYDIAFRIPTGTALSEEIVFRGALLGMFSRKHTSLRAATTSALLFGLWHVWPALRQAVEGAGARRASLKQVGSSVAAPLAFTYVAGLMLATLRYKSHSIVAPWLVHASANAAGYSAIWLAARRDAKAKHRLPGASP